MSATLEDFQRRRLKEKDIVIEEVFGGEYEDQKFFRRTDSSIKEDIINRPKIEKRYFYQDKCIFIQKKFNPNSLYTFYSGDSNEDFDCPSCSYTGKTSEFVNGCPFCRTRVNRDYRLKRQGSHHKRRETIDMDLFKKISIFAIGILLIFKIITNGWILGVFATLVLSPILAGIIYCAFVAIQFPGTFYNIVKNEDYLNVWRNFQKIGIITKQSSLFNCLHTELERYYYNDKISTQYSDLIDFDILSYKDFDVVYRGEQEVYMYVKYIIRKVYLKNGRIISTVNKSYVKMKRNSIHYSLDEENLVLKCPHCGASLKVSQENCEYCGDEIDFNGEWIIDKIINDKM